MSLHVYKHIKSLIKGLIISPIKCLNIQYSCVLDIRPPTPILLLFQGTYQIPYQISYQIPCHIHLSVPLSVSPIRCLVIRSVIRFHRSCSHPRYGNIWIVIAASLCIFMYIRMDVLGVVKAKF